MASQDDRPDPTPDTTADPTADPGADPGVPSATPPHGDPLRPEIQQPGPPTDPGNPATG